MSLEDGEFYVSKGAESNDLECLCRVTTPLSPTVPGTSGPECKLDENSTIPDIRPGRSGVGGVPDMVRGWL
jgi:hypothetical protein